MLGFLEDRLGLVTFWRSSMSGKRPPRGVGWLRTLGFCALTVALLQLMSGIALAMHYVPSAELAYDSIRAFEQDVTMGALVRSLHHFGASAFVIFMALHVMRVFFTGAYKKPRELTWITGVGLMVVVLAFGFTGYLLPWDQKAYFATKVGTEIAGKAPVVGETVRVMLNGGDAVGPPTLTRFYVIHVVLLPLALFGLLGVHLYLIQRHGVAAPGRPVGDEGEPGEPYFPNHVFKEAVAGLLVAGALFAVSAYWRAPLEAMAMPSDTGYEPRPDWYFAGLFQLLKVFEGPLEPIGTFWLPNLVLVAMILLPFIDRTKQRHWSRRPVMTVLGLLFVASVVGLTAIGAFDVPHNEPTLRHELGLTQTERRGYLLVRQHKCTDCHAIEQGGVTIGGSEDLPDTPFLDELDQEWEDFDAILVAPAEVLDEETEMPSFDHVSEEQRRAMWVYLKTLVR